MDPVFSLISAYTRLPAGWGFPDPPRNLPAETEGARVLREALFPFQGEEGVAQMVRWHYGLVRSYPAVALGIGDGHESYDPGLAWKPPLEIGSDEVFLTADPASGMLEMLWEPSSGHLSGTIRVEGGDMFLDLGGTTHRLPYGDSAAGSIPILWPGFLRTRAAFTALPTKPFPIVFRPRNFDTASMADAAASAVGSAGPLSIQAAGEWAHATPEERLALSWAIMQNLRNV